MKTCSYCGAHYADDLEVCPVDQQGLTAVTQPALEISAASVLKHSTLGIVSFGISVAVGVLMAALFVVAAVLSTGQTHAGHPYPGQTLVGLAAIGLLATDVAAVALGIAALCQHGTKPLFGILGLVFSTATILGTIGLMVVGLVYASRFAS